jgi:two-component system, chemotaxis family, response regulator WspF
MRIGIVNDMFMAVEAMRRVVANSPGNEVAWIARDGAQAVELCIKDKPDMVLMDLVMPHMDGVEATRQIMAKAPCPIVVVTASIEDRPSKVYEAMGAGALDAVNTPVLEQPGNLDGARPLLAKIETIRKLIGPVGGRMFGVTPATVTPASRTHSGLVVVGASAGGPAALAKMLSALPADFAAGIVIVQHVDAQFAPGLASWLGDQSPLVVKVAAEGDRPEAGRVLLAGHAGHLILKSGNHERGTRSAERGTEPKGTCVEQHAITHDSSFRVNRSALGVLGYTAEPRECVYQPSVDVLFQSAARQWEGPIIGVLLTGMGRDGAQGLKALRERGHVTIAQDESSCAVFGMPRAAIESGAASEILTLDKIAPRLTNMFR